jgi:hypothetical protein
LSVPPSELVREDATFLFEGVNKRYGAAKSTIITSNKSYGQWQEILPDPILAVALLDRLLHHSVVLNIRGDSDRQRHRKNVGLPSLQSAKADDQELRGTNMKPHQERQARDRRVQN